MNDIGRQLIALLRKDARTNVATPAAKLGVSRGTLTNRLRRLEDENVIVGYSVRLIKGIANTKTSILLATYR